MAQLDLIKAALLAVYCLVRQDRINVILFALIDGVKFAHLALELEVGSHQLAGVGLRG